MRAPSLSSVRPTLSAVFALGLALGVAAGAAPAGATALRHEDQRLTWPDASLPAGSHYGASVGLAAAGEWAFVGAPQGRSRASYLFEDGAWQMDFAVTGGGDDPSFAACSDGASIDLYVLAATRHIAGTYRVGRMLNGHSPYISGIEGGHVRALASLGTVLALGQPDYAGGSGRLLIYELQDGDWQVTGDLVGPAGSRLGASVAIIAPTIVVAGQPGRSPNGAAQVYVNSGGWIPFQLLEPDYCCSTDAQFGAAIATADGTIAVGAPGWDRPLAGGGVAENVGTVALYDNPVFGWELAAVARPIEASANDAYGSSVALRTVGELGAVLLAGAPFDALSATDQGTAYVWWLAGGAWQAKWRLAAASASIDEQLGTSVALGPRGALVGAPNRTSNGLAEQGAAYFFAGVVPLFYDGVESGDTEGWSSALP